MVKDETLLLGGLLVGGALLASNFAKGLGSSLAPDPIQINIPEFPKIEFFKVKNVPEAPKSLSICKGDVGLFVPIPTLPVKEALSIILIPIYFYID